MILNTGVDWSALRRFAADDERWLLPYLDKKEKLNIVQWGAGTGAIRSIFSGDAHFLGYETNPQFVAQAQGRKISVELRDPALQLPLEPTSQDVYLVLDYLEYLRMDQLYMVLAEARRVLKPKGLCFLRGLSPKPGKVGQLACSIWTRLAERKPNLVHGRRPLELTHYISPEDWKTLRDTRTNAAGTWASFQTLVLERL